MDKNYPELLEQKRMYTKLIQVLNVHPVENQKKETLKAILNYGYQETLQEIEIYYSQTQEVIL